MEEAQKERKLNQRLCNHYRADQDRGKCQTEWSPPVFLMKFFIGKLGQLKQTKFSAEFSMKILCRKRMQLLSSKIINIWLTSQVHWRSLLNLDWDEILRHISTFTRNKQTHSNTVIKVNSQLPTLITCMVYNSIFGLLLKKTNQTDLCHWKLQIPLSPKDELGPGTSHHGITYL